MTQGMSFGEIEQIVAQRVVNAIETIAIYEAKTRVARDLMNQVERQEEKVADNASNKRKWKGNHNNNNYNQNKRHEVARVYTVGPTDKGKYVGDLPHCRMNVQKQETRPEATRIREAEMEELMVKETMMGIKLAETPAS
ncbi:hypothetical protein Tco_0874055 [Tanacetum coccineum]|uniref:Reverse transcriptase domain-containing protein n=1 Tax=Tanacetum coccineum TaxID=301880 RepID=A0ABQ5BM80_9ASTR